MEVTWTARRVEGHPSCIVVDVPVESQTGFELEGLLSSDRHWDNPKSDHALQRKHLDDIKAKGGFVLDDGDFFCAMQGKWDKRADKSCVRPEHQNGRYLDSLVETGAEFFEPYAHNIIAIGRGNHEQAIKKRHETDLTERLVALINARSGANVIAGGYTNWVRFRFRRGEQTVSKTIWMMHGYAGGGPVTRDLIQLNRQLAYVRGADIMVSGHTHDAWHVRHATVEMDTLDRIRHRTIDALKVPTYKEEYCDGHSGWHVETGKPPKPIGAWRVRFYWDGTTVDHEITFAK